LKQIFCFSRASVVHFQKQEPVSLELGLPQSFQVSVAKLWLLSCSNTNSHYVSVAMQAHSRK